MNYRAMLATCLGLSEGATDEELQLAYDEQTEPAAEAAPEAEDETVENEVDKAAEEATVPYRSPSMKALKRKPVAA